MISLYSAYLIAVVLAVFSLLFGFWMGYKSGIDDGLQIGTDTERDKWHAIALKMGELEAIIIRFRNLERFVVDYHRALLASKQ